MNQVVQHTRMTWIVRVNFLKEISGLELDVKTFGAFPDSRQNGKAVEKLGLIVWKARIGRRHGIAIGCVALGFQSCARILEQSGDGVEVELLARGHFLRRQSF